MANRERDDPGAFGGKVQEEADVMKVALRYQNRFEPDREPRGHNMGDADEVRG